MTSYIYISEETCNPAPPPTAFSPFKKEGFHIKKGRRKKYIYIAAQPVFPPSPLPTLPIKRPSPHSSSSSSSSSLPHTPPLIIYKSQFFQKGRVKPPPPTRALSPFCLTSISKILCLLFFFFFWYGGGKRKKKG